ncbi:MAG: MauE/DoxX family redox-associated membrane protein [Solitalea sp.]
MKTLQQKSGSIFNRVSVREGIADAAAYVFIFLFLYTASSKLMDLDTFRTALGNSVLLEGITPLLAYAIPLLEIGVAAMLIIPRTRQVGMRLSCMLMIVFTVYLLYMVLFARVKTCHCGGVVSKLSWEEHIWFNLALIALGFTGLRMKKFQLTNFLTLKSKKS